ncbi:hypothetical protein EVG20_g11713 [Dentipellis fragilis]|uniref:Uncharacterized protein n=1 Tax=Dentipellis fragilis TaxID=205917 RepID=A0A4Y9XL83_9AGAM|nr:hypothetical protein EVG20_g11713 [Dentipellis fragilis]
MRVLPDRADHLGCSRYQWAALLSPAAPPGHEARARTCDDAHSTLQLAAPPHPALEPLHAARGTRASPPNDRQLQ